MFYVCNKYCCNYLGQHRDKVKSQHIGKLTSRRVLSFDDVSKSLARSMRSMNLSQFCADVDIWGIIPAAVTQIIVSTFGLSVFVFLLLEFVIRDEILIMATPISRLVSTYWFVVIVPFHPVWRVVLPSHLSQDICALSKYQRSFNSQKNLLDICSLKKKLSVPNKKVLNISAFKYLSLSRWNSGV